MNAAGCALNGSTQGAAVSDVRIGGAEVRFASRCQRTSIRTLVALRQVADLVAAPDNLARPGGHGAHYSGPESATGQTRNKLRYVLSETVGNIPRVVSCSVSVQFRIRLMSVWPPRKSSSKNRLRYCRQDR
ncbi:hypothetical protein V1283_008637 [Bradyrhizobium sp. AZCC 2262]